MEPMATPTGTQAVERAARLLTEIVDAGEAATFSELTQRTGLAKSTTSRLLLALERARLVRREEGAYRAGELFVRYAWRSSSDAGLARIAQPVLERLGATTGETVNLGVAHAGAVEQIAQVDSPHLLGTTNWVGRRVPLHASALGKVLLAFGGAELPPGHLERCTDRTITSRAALAVELEEVRHRGFGVTDEELEMGLIAIAAPVFRTSGSPLAALSVSAPASRLTKPELPAATAACVREAAALSHLLGHRPVTDRSRREGEGAA
jgi:DNA-binding IclR family transcriptional regulator